MGEMGRGSRKRFHSAWRQSTGQVNVHFSSHLLNINLTYKEAMSWEEYHTDRIGPNLLNMISGGFKGLRELCLKSNTPGQIRLKIYNRCRTD